MTLDVGHGLTFDLQTIFHPHLAHDLVEGSLNSERVHHHQVQGLGVRQQLCQAESMLLPRLSDKHVNIP